MTTTASGVVSVETLVDLSERVGITAPTDTPVTVARVRLPEGVIGYGIQDSRTGRLYAVLDEAADDFLAWAMASRLAMAADDGELTPDRYARLFERIAGTFTDGPIEEVAG
ncbi:hypothetical protein [Yinghuangia soli]|uniref:Uncharacterized protein n=1 Tax=Yinghuangia soli TaxID=2908204 RepID=A0AA41TZ05_9ACTN|nr:hypothetical protein [Yinghuangia soli]MCF2526740.1 hypothetical protein [Yinghuangia soli]